MKQFKSVPNITEELDQVVCNMCGEEIKKNNFGYLDDYVSIEKQWGYGSPHDGETHSIDLCQSCYEKFIHTFKILPNHGNSN